MEGMIEHLSSYVPPGLPLSLSAAFISSSKYLPSYQHEFIGSILMIVLTFSAGKWVGTSSTTLAWLSHSLGVIGADYWGDGPHVNPAVSFSMWILGKVNYTEMYVRIAGQMAGGLITFPLCRYFSDVMGWEALGGPEFKQDAIDPDGSLAFFSEFCATTLLCYLIYVVNFELDFGEYHYWIKQSLTALGIRYLIEVFPTAGPAMNPMLATTWAAFAVTDENAFPHDFEHYFVFWIGPFLGAFVASLTYVLYAGGTIWGRVLPFEPIKTV